MSYIRLSILSFTILFLSSCESDSRNITERGDSAIQSTLAGQNLYSKYCARCHGPDVMGSDKGPPLIHKIYEPDHHADASFYRAVKMGSRAHHWKFGDMPPINRVSEAEVTEIINYVRDEQRKAGIN